MIETRPARPDDAMDVARIHVRSWQVGYRGLLPDAYLDALRPEDRAPRYLLGSLDPSSPATFVAEQNGVMVGFVTVGESSAGETAKVGAILGLYVDPQVWGRGVGQTLMRVARAYLLRRGFVDAVLWLLAGNERAKRFYERDGWSEDGLMRTEEVWGVRVDEVRFRRDLTA